MLVAQPLLHLFLIHHMAQITTYCRRFFFTLMQRKLDTVHTLKPNAVLQMRQGYSSCVCVQGRTLTTDYVDYKALPAR